MNNKKIIGVIITLAIMVSAMSGCSCSNQSELHKMIERGDSITIEVVEPDFEEQGTETKITWVELAKLMSYEDYRIGVDNALGVTSDGISKYGVIYIDSEGNQTGNATLYDAFLNKAFVDSYWNNETVQNQLIDGVGHVYADLEESDYNAAIINAYWNLLPDNQPNYFNGGSSLTRAEAMALVMRATTPVTESGTPNENADFKTAVGDSDYTNYASYVAGNNYLTTADKSLNNQTFNGTMTRGEYIYLLMANTFGVDTINKVDVSGIKLNDCKDGGDIAKAQEFSNKDYCKSYELVYALQNVDAGAPTSMYKAIVAAYKYEIISAETRWDEAITKTEAIDLFVETVQAYSNLNGYKTDIEVGVEKEDEGNINIEAEASKAFDELTVQLTIDKAIFVSEYKTLISDNYTSEEAINNLIERFKVVEKEEEKPTDPVDLPEYRETVGNYTEAIEGIFAIRTWDNGAKRYFVYDSILQKYYPIEKYEYDTGNMPLRVYEQNQADYKALQESWSTEEETTSGTTGGTTSTQTPTETPTNPSGPTEEQQITVTPEEDPFTQKEGGDLTDGPLGGGIAH